MQQWYRYSDQNYRGEYSGNLSHLLLWPTLAFRVSSGARILCEALFAKSLLVLQLVKRLHDVLKMTSHIRPCFVLRALPEVVHSRFPHSSLA